MNFTFNNSSIVSVNSGTIVLNVSGKIRTFVDAKLVSVIDGEIVLDLPEASFKKGSYITFLMKRDSERTFILSKHTDVRIYYHVSTKKFSSLAYNDFWFKDCNKFRNATPEEIQELNDQLEAEGKRWNPDTMQIEKFRWKPLRGENYFYIVLTAVNIEISSFVCHNDSVDQRAYETHNCFKTKEEAEAKLEQIKQILNPTI